MYFLKKILVCCVVDNNEVIISGYTVVPATGGHLRFGAKVAPRGRWPLVAGNGNS